MSSSAFFSERDVARAVATHGVAALEMEVSRCCPGAVSCSDRFDRDRHAADGQHQVRLLPVWRRHADGSSAFSDVIRDLQPELKWSEKFARVA